MRRGYGARYPAPMTTLVEIRVAGDGVTVSVPARRWSRRWLDLMAIKGNRIVSVGDSPEIAAADAATAGRSAELEDVRWIHPFADEPMDPQQWLMFLRFVLSRALAESGVGVAGFVGEAPDLALTVPGWEGRDPEARRAFVKGQRFVRRLVVNGRIVSRPRLGVPFVWSLFGRRYDPNP